MNKQIKRLRQNKGNPYRYFRIMLFLIERSLVFRVSAINKTMRGWYKNMPLSEVFRINREINRLITSGQTKLDFKRVYIPKGKED
jgi:hypothetical protein